ncbi:hypothetical protein EV146_10862 [Mesobacillus foraminis]|uniref:Uncharacterized protein n=1 Tax=Mesobacillus foraminis TaxID=279826 RepID=A0A4R2BDP8_9BACI|nr:hypothetical protein EV146_10862 [Mesobacillus foraminis]
MGILFFCDNSEIRFLFTLHLLNRKQSLIFTGINPSWVSLKTLINACI